ncbi:tetratricopeptide repeat protein [Gimesia aquarii]|uniref:Tetratricopeptide repeat protein n=1 Tax=Gimesia aquarii TaxID=2527964 RepID=A0A517WZY1_9PLAN|nr:hypothetical protein [Gimesia aquarii]QDU10813.1 hypothetical protein V202x_42260 [Gimesia aquarii]
MTEHDLSTIDWRLRRFLLLIMTVSFVLTPLSAPEIWWQLSRGRVVISDLSPPGPILTAGNNPAEADWLGGLPFYLAYQGAGFSGLMILKIAAVGLLLYSLLNHYETKLNWRAFFVVILTLMAANPAWQPTPRLLDCWFLFLTWIMTERWCQEPHWKKKLPVLVLLILWANISPLSLLGIPVVLFVPWLKGVRTESTSIRRQTCLMLLATCLALMITPRGWFTPFDSFVQLFPGLFYDRVLLSLTIWQPTFQQGATIEVLAFGMLTAWMALLLILYSASWLETIAFLAFAIPGWTNYDCLPPCVIGVSLLACQCMLTDDVPSQVQKWKLLISPAMGRLVLIIGVFLIGWKSASGTIPGQSQRLGWGIDPELDITLLNQTIGPIDYRGTGHGMGIASTGMLCWIKSDRKIQPVRTLRQALLQGLLFEEISLNQELSNGWVFQHPRSDNSWGGWWVRLKKRNCQLLLVPNGDAKTIRALIDSRWQPMSVDASVIPFGWSGELLSSPKIVELLPAKEFLNRQAWTYSLPEASGTPDCFDLWGAFTGLPNPRPSLLQAKTFRAMKLYTAALRVLQPLLQHYHTPAVIQEFQLCQKELGYQEKLETGSASHLRSLAYNITKREADLPLNESGLRTIKPNKPQKVSDRFQNAIQDYARGDWEAAIKKLSTDDSETLYAKAQILLESGDPQSAALLLQKLIQQHPDNRLAVPSQIMLKSIQ